MDVSSTVRLLVFPHDDQALESKLAGIASEVNGWDRVGPDYLQQRLRAFYPQVVVREQDPLGALAIRGSTWYVYRDGSPRRS
jgi:hypothetical protein